MVAIPVHEERKERTPQPLPLWLALLFFAIPALVFRISLYHVFPALLNAGFVQLTAVFTAFLLPLFLLLVAALVFYRLEGYRFTWKEFTGRMRLRAPTGRAWLWALGGLVVSFVGTGLLTSTSKWLASFPLFAPPAFMPV
jgi:hypothetical protein